MTSAELRGRGAGPDAFAPLPFRLGRARRGPRRPARFHRVGSVALMVAVITAGFVAAAPPAAAHSVSGITSTNWVTKIISVQPALPGLTVKAVQLGNLIELTNDGPDLVVLGYNGEPYLQVGPGGVFENLRSPATYLNRTRQGTTPVPSTASDKPNTPPQWKRISIQQTVVFHDHRTHWMGGELPAPIRADSHRTFELTPNWQIHIRQGPTTAVITGSLTWVPGPNPWPWILGAVTLAGVTGMILRARRWLLLLTLALSLLVASDVVHTTGIASTAIGGFDRKAVQFVRGSFYSFPGWILAAVAIRNLRRPGGGGFLAAIFAGIWIFLGTGLADFATLYHSQAPFGWGILLDRLTIIIALGVGLGVIVAAAAIGQRFFEIDDDEPADLSDRDDTERWPDLRLVTPPHLPPAPS